MNPEQRIKEIQKEMVKVSVLESPGAFMLALGLYGKFFSEGDAFLPILNNETVVNVLLGLGVAIMLWGATRIMSLVREGARLNEEKEMLDKLKG